MKSYRPLSRSLNTKLLFMLMLVAFFTSITTALLFTGYELKTVTSTERIRLNSIANILAPNLTAAVIFEDEYNVNELIKPLLSQGNIVSARVLDVYGNTVAEVISKQQKESYILTDIMAITVPLKLEGNIYGRLEIRADYSLIENSLLLFCLFLLVILVFILALSFLLALFLRKNLIHPLIHLTSVADQVTRTRNYSMRAQVLSTDEVGNLANYFNLMLETVEERDNRLEVQVLQRTEALKRANEKLSKQANSDPLSGLPNRRYVLDRLSKIIDADHPANNVNFVVLGLDLDGFKEINDTLGHDYGDLLLIAVSKRITGALPKKSLVARLGGDEFLVVIDNIADKVLIESLVDKLQKAIAESFVIKGEFVYVTASIGIAVYPEHGRTVESIVKYADLAMYKSKANGRNCYHFFNPDMLDNLLKKRELIDDLRRGISAGEFVLYYQPIVDLQTDKVCKAEALLRWNHPTRGILPPGEFIAVAEETGIIKELGEWVALSASHDIAGLRKAQQASFQISINVSPLQFKDDEQWILNWFACMKELEIAPDAIIVEITENVLMESEDQIRSKLVKLKDYGIDIAIDDFGVGYSSLSYLQKMDVEILKIDKSFVDNLITESNSRDLCRAMIIMARHLNIQVVAEGIESAEQKHILAEAGCQFGQGYLFSEPLPLNDFKLKYFNALPENPSGNPISQTVTYENENNCKEKERALSDY